MTDELCGGETVGFGHEEITHQPEKQGSPQVSELADGSQGAMRCQGENIHISGSQIFRQEIAGKDLVPHHQLRNEIACEC